MLAYINTRYTVANNVILNSSDGILFFIISEFLVNITVNILKPSTYF